MKTAPLLTLARWLAFGEWRAYPLRHLAALLAIAIGVALGYAIYLINSAAFNEFSAAVRSLSGEADLRVSTAHPVLDESIYARIAAMDEVELASPVLELDLAPVGQESRLKLLGIDVLTAAAVTPDLVGVPQDARLMDTLADDTVFLSPAALDWLQVEPGANLVLQSGTRRVSLRVAGRLTAARPGQRLATMDIGAMQWRFARLGELSHVDLRLKPGVDREAFARQLPQRLGTHIRITHSAQMETRAASMSRAYRVNLNMLAMVALFTGAFLVFSSQALSVLRRRSQLALLRVLGATRAQLLRQILAEGLALGTLGSLLGLALGYGFAAFALRQFGGDLGGGYFPGIQPRAAFSLPAALVFFALGTVAALLGCTAPAREAARARPAHALKGGSEDAAMARLSSPWPGLALLAAGIVLAAMPPLFGLPLFGYTAIALLLVGTILLMPRVAAVVFGALARRAETRPAAIPVLAMSHLANAPNQASIALGGVLTSFSLMVAMAIMVASFRISVDDWLGQVLAADLYAGAESGSLSLPEQEAIAALPVVARAAFQRNTKLDLDPARAPVALLAREMARGDPARLLPLIGESLRPDALPPGTTPVWVSEAMVDLYGYTRGDTIALPIGTPDRRFVVAGIWRDYVRQTGAIQIALSDYRALTGDFAADDAALWLREDIPAEQGVAALRALPFGASLSISLPDEIRALSLDIFDRSFAVTYLLEAVAIAVGMFGVAATFSAQTLARAREFGMLRHIGATRRQILSMLGLEGGLLACLGIVLGLALGSAISLILVHVVNPQSFHWTMEWHFPWTLLAPVALALLGCAALTALVAGRHAVSADVLQAVRQDW